MSYVDSDLHDHAFCVDGGPCLDCGEYGTHRIEEWEDWPAEYGRATGRIYHLCDRCLASRRMFEMMREEP